MKIYSIALVGAAVVGCAGMPQQSEPANVELGIQDFSIHEQGNGATIIGTDAAGAQIARIDVQVGRVKSIPENHLNAELPVPEYWDNGVRFEISFKADHRAYDFAGIPDRLIKWGLDAREAVMVNDPAIAPILAKYHVILEAATEAQLSEVATGEEPYTTWVQWPSGGGALYSLVAGCDGTWRSAGSNYPGSTPGARCTTPAPRACNNDAYGAFSWGWYEAGGSGGVYDILQSCVGGASGWPYTWSWMSCNTNSGGGYDSCGQSGPLGTEYPNGRCSPCNMNLHGANYPPWLKNNNNTSLAYSW